MNEMQEVTKNLREIREAVDLIKSLAEDRERWAVTVNDVGETLADSLMSAAETVERLSTGLGALGTALSGEGKEVAGRLVEFRQTAERLLEQLRTATESRDPGADIAVALGRIEHQLDSLQSRQNDLERNFRVMVGDLERNVRNVVNDAERNLRVVVKDELEKSSGRIMGSVDVIHELLAELEAARQQRNPLKRLFSGGQPDEV